MVHRLAGGTDNGASGASGESFADMRLAGGGPVQVDYLLDIDIFANAGNRGIHGQQQLNRDIESLRNVKKGISFNDRVSQQCAGAVGRGGSAGAWRGAEVNSRPLWQRYGFLIGHEVRDRRVGYKSGLFGGSRLGAWRDRRGRCGRRAG